MKREGCRVLVAEDSPTQAERLRLLLEGEGYTVDIARNGRDGLARVRSRPPDLVISDVVMPEMDGYALCEAVKASNETRRTTSSGSRIRTGRFPSSWAVWAR